MTDMPVQLVRLTKRIAYLEKKVRDDGIGQYSAHSLKEYFDDEMSEEMKAVAEKYLDLEERVQICEGNIENLDYRLEEIERKLAKLASIIEVFGYSDSWHTGSDFCGNCVHCSHVAPDINYVCELSGEIVDPDDSSCTMFEPPF